MLCTGDATVNHFIVIWKAMTFINSILQIIEENYRLRIKIINSIHKQCWKPFSSEPQHTLNLFLSLLCGTAVGLQRNKLFPWNWYELLLPFILMEATKFVKGDRKASVLMCSSRHFSSSLISCTFHTLT